MCQETETVSVDLDRATAADLHRRAMDVRLTPEEIAEMLLDQALNRMLDQMSTPRRWLRD